MHKFITEGGFWVRYIDGDTDKLHVFFKTKRDGIEKTGTFKKQIIIRYYKSCRLRPDIEINPIKRLNGESLYSVIDKKINEELDKTLNSGNIPQLKTSAFGTFFGNGNAKRNR